MRHRWWLIATAITALLASGLAGLGPAAQAGTARHASSASKTPSLGIAGGITGLAAGNKFCQLLGKRYQASSGAQMFCFGANLHANSQARTGAAAVADGSGAPQNSNAASVREDVSPAGLRAYGQSETSVAASGRYVVEAWNDSTTFFTACGARHNKEEATGVGFSADGGRTFTDLGGEFNPNCKNYVYVSDPSVVAYRLRHQTWFYIAGMFDSTIGSPQSYIALDACLATGSGHSARLRCGRPDIAAASTECLVTKFFTQCTFLDKDYLAIDPARGRLYLTYSEFPFLGGGNTIQMTACDIGTRSGHAGPAGGTPAKPVCKHGTKLVKQPKLFQGGHLYIGKPYFTVSGPGFRGCENEGAYPAVNVQRGTVYVGFEYNWATNQFFGCNGSRTKTRDVLTEAPLRCLTLTAVAKCSHPIKRTSIAVISLDAALIPGYNRFPTNDFPRLAVSSRFGVVSMVWNDTRYHPFGDALLESFKLGSLKRVQRIPVTLDQPHGGGLTMFPSMRVSNGNGLLDVAWYSRRGVGTANTSVVAAIGVNPRATSTPSNIFITNVASNWLVNNSDIIPNFGDYIDASLNATGTWPYVGNTFYVAWSDGRLGLPQPFEAHVPAG